MPVVQYFACTFYFTVCHLLTSWPIGRYDKNKQVQQANLLTINIPFQKFVLIFTPFTNIKMNLRNGTLIVQTFK